MTKKGEMQCWLIMLGVLALGLTFACSKKRERAETKPEETGSKVVEFDRNRDGVIDYRVETFFRGKEKALQIVSRLKSGVWHKTRFFSVAGAIVVTEIDSDGDGLFETLIISNGEQDAVEMFQRFSGDRLKLASAESLAEYQKSKSLQEQFWKKASETNDQNEFWRLFKNTQEQLSK